MTRRWIVCTSCKNGRNVGDCWRCNGEGGWQEAETKQADAKARLVERIEAEDRAEDLAAHN